MFEDDDSALGRRKKRRVRINSLPMASKCINAIMGPLLEAVKKNEVLRWKLFEVRFLANLKGDDMVVTMLYHKPLGVSPAARIWLCCHGKLDFLVLS